MADVWDEQAAAAYDSTIGDWASPAVIGATVGVLADLARGGPALELAIGTGRIALPLAERGIPVHGIELSPAMVDELRRKEGGDRIPVTIGDMATTRVPGEFRLVFLVFNTITNLLTQAEQVACFRNAAAHLEPGGSFVVETFVPQLRRLPPGSTFVSFDVSPDHVGIDEYDVVHQRLVSHHTWFGPDGVRRGASRHRYAWPAEYDLMAESADLEPVARWGGWDRSPFTADSPSHVSVWRRR